MQKLDSKAFERGVASMLRNTLIVAGVLAMEIDRETIFVFISCDK